MSSLNAHLKALLADLTAELPEVTERLMFGADAFFANGNIFSMAHDGRIFVKLPDPARFEAACKLEGSGRFDPMGTGKSMGSWVSLPEEWHDDVDALQPWVEDAHRLAMAKPPKGAKKAKKARSPSPRPAPRSAGRGGKVATSARSAGSGKKKR